MTVSEVLYNFWSSFGLPAYDAYTVPDEAEMPYITYEVSDSFFGALTDMSQSASIWYHSTSWVEITEKAEQIADFIGRGGRMLAVDGGAIWIKRGSSWAQRMPETADRMVRRMVLNYEVEFIK